MAVVNSVGNALTGSTGTGAFVGETSPTLVTPTIGAATGTSITFSPTTGGIVGTTTNDDANAGIVGQYVTASIPFSSAVSLTTGTTANVTELTSLAAGDWDVWGEILMSGTATSVADSNVAISLTTATMPGEPSVGLARTADSSLGSFAATGARRLTTGVARISIASATTVYLVASCVFSGGTSTVSGAIKARRVR